MGITPSNNNKQMEEFYRRQILQQAEVGFGSDMANQSPGQACWHSNHYELRYPDMTGIIREEDIISIYCREILRSITFCFDFDETRFVSDLILIILSSVEERTAVVDVLVIQIKNLWL
jgi:hypothetical protein